MHPNACHVVLDENLKMVLTLQQPKAKQQQNKQKKHLRQNEQEQNYKAIQPSCRC
jgi:hypothetical protein